MLKINSLYLLLLFSISAGLTSCEKYLDAKSNRSLAIPSTPEDLQALLDNFGNINYRGVSMGEASADDYFMSQTDYTGLAENLKRTYTWEKDNLFASEDNDWSAAYNRIYQSNVVLDYLRDLSPGFNQTQVSDIKGQALYIRSFVLFQLVTTFSLAYDPATANTELGVPLRLTSDLNEKIFRPTVKQTFDQIINDLKEASAVLSNSPVHVFRASKPAALALLARTYMYMNDYENCYKYADTCLTLKSNLISYNTPTIPNLDASFPFSVTSLAYNNPELIFASRMAVPRLLNNAVSKIDTTLISQYVPGDNRKRVYFRLGTGVNNKYYVFKGSYDGTANLLDGISTDEVYLMRAESEARLNKVPEAMNDLNKLLKTRWDKAATYVDIAAANQTEAINIILKERRKSLVMRGLRWIDIKRLNVMGANISPKHIANGVEYQLPANDLRYAVAIPESIIRVSGMQQNRR
jgi:hypothetical protein